MLPIVVRHFEYHGHCVIFHFTDGHTAIIGVCLGGFGNNFDQPFEAFLLNSPDGKQRACFHSPHQYPRNRPGDGFQPVDDDSLYSLERIVAYWEISYLYLQAFQRAGDRRPHMIASGKIVGSSGTYLEEVKAGKWPLPQE
jgi:hypothetical protein